MPTISPFAQSTGMASLAQQSAAAPALPPAVQFGHETDTVKFSGLGKKLGVLASGAALVTGVALGTAGTAQAAETPGQALAAASTHLAPDSPEAKTLSLESNLSDQGDKSTLNKGNHGNTTLAYRSGNIGNIFNFIWRILFGRGGGGGNCPNPAACPPAPNA